MSKIKQLKVTNFQKIKVASLSLEAGQGLVPITGRNGQGKSSLINSLISALGGKNSSPDLPIRLGEDKAEVEVELDSGWIIKRSFTEKGTYLTVSTADGAKFPKAQSKLDSLISNVSFDPLKFSQLTPVERKESLIQVIGKKDDLDRLDNEIKKLKEERLFANRDLKQLQGEFEGIKINPEDLDIKPLSVVEISNKIQSYNDFVNRGQALKRDRDSQSFQVERNEKDIKELEKKIIEIKEQNELLNKGIVDMDKGLADLRVEMGEKFPDMNIEGLREALNNAEAHNKKAEEVKRYKDVEERLEAKSKESLGFDRQIEAKKLEKEAIILMSDLPIEGLGVEEDITYNGIPFKQLSSAEQIKVSSLIGMSMNPELRVMFIKDGSLLDDVSFEELNKLAEEMDYQVWVEVVSNESELGFEIEDGEVVNKNESLEAEIRMDKIEAKIDAEIRDLFDPSEYLRSLNK